MRHIVLPQAMLYMIAPLLNSFLSLIKTATLASAIGLPEILYHSQNEIQTTGEVTRVIVVVIVIYAVVCMPLIRLTARRRAAHEGTALHLKGDAVTTTHPGSVRRIPEPNYPNFPAEEIAARCRRMRGVMAEEGIDLLLLTERENVVYFSGLSSCAWVQKGVVPAVVLLHVDTDEPVMLLPDFWLGTAEKTTWYRDFILHRASHSDPNDFVNLLVSTIKERGWGGGRIGYEAGHEMLMGLPIADWEHLRGQLDTPFVPAAKPIWKVRMIKSQARGRAACGGRRW